MIEIISFIAALVGIVLLAVGAITRYIDDEPNSIGVTGVALFIVGLLLAYGPHA